MKIKEFIVVPKKNSDTISSGTTSSAIKGQPTQDIVPQDIVGEIESHPDHSAITEGVSQIFRRQKGTQPKHGKARSGARPLQKSKTVRVK